MKTFEVMIEYIYTASYEAETEEEALEIHKTNCLKDFTEGNYFITGWELPEDEH